MAAGRIVTGFSKPYIAKYVNTSGTITYSDGMRLARGVSVTLSPESGDDNYFYADNVAAESAGGVFTGGSVTLEVDGLNPAARALANGLPEAGQDGWIADGDTTAPPYLGLGWITRYMSDAVAIYVPTIMTKTKLSIPEETAETQGEAIEWQPSTLTASLMRDDSANHIWRYIGADFSTEEAAEAALKTKLGITP